MTGALAGLLGLAAGGCDDGTRAPAPSEAAGTAGAAGAGGTSAAPAAATYNIPVSNTPVTYEDCVKLLDEGKEIRYKGPSGIGPINDKNDPSSAFVGIFKYNAQNKNELASTVEGSS